LIEVKSMGIWGLAIRSDDFVADVVYAYKASLKASQDLQSARSEVIDKFAEIIKHGDEAPLFWIAIADVQWEYGVMDAEAFQFVAADYRHGRGLENWEANPKQLLKRRAVLEAFLQKLQAPNPKPAKIPRLIRRPPPLAAGDCLSVVLDGGYYGAAIVTVADASDMENGTNLVGVLDYYSRKRPDCSVFNTRNWLVLTHHHWNGIHDFCWYSAHNFKSIKNRLEIVCRTEIVECDKQPCKSYRHWDNLCVQAAYQREWDRREADA
jgi:hypothetical protein